MRRHRTIRTTLLAILGLFAALVFIQPGGSASAATSCPKMVYSTQQANGAANVVYEQDCASQDLSARFLTIPAIEPQMSPNGERLAYSNHLVTTDTTGIQLVISDADGTGPRTESPGPMIMHPSWSPDSQRLIAVELSSRLSISGTLVLITVNQDKTFDITPTTITGDSPNWCRDGSIVYAQNGHIWRMNADQTDNQQLTNGTTYDDHPACTPDSNDVVYDSQPNDGSVGPNIFVISKLGGATAQLTQLDGFNTKPSVSGDWTLAFSHETQEMDTSLLYTLPLGEDTPAPDSAAIGNWQSDPAYWEGDPATDPPANWPPTGITPPTNPPPTTSLDVKSVSITASPNDQLLNRMIKIAPEDPSAKIARYEYGWTKTATSSTVGSIQKCNVSLPACLLNYGPTKPQKKWNLLARTVAKNGTAGAWYKTTVQTPKAPMLFLFGDSITSGHHRDAEGTPTICEDKDYSYGKTVWDQMETQIPSQWRLATGYINDAESGFNTTKVINGGQDACKVKKPAELPDLKKRLVANAGSWNWVMGTAGINDTNWGDVVANIVGGNVAGKIKTTAQCQSYVNAWNFHSTRSRLTMNVGSISDQLEQSDPLARRYWISYYNIANTGTGVFKAPLVCKQPFEASLSSMSAALKQGLSPLTRWVDIDSTLGSHDNLLQDFYVSDIAGKNSGWPHPNKSGHEQIATKILQTP